MSRGGSAGKESEGDGLEVRSHNEAADRECLPEGQALRHSGHRHRNLGGCVAASTQAAPLLRANPFGRGGRPPRAPSRQVRSALSCPRRSPDSASHGDAQAGCIPPHGARASRSGAVSPRGCTAPCGTGAPHPLISTAHGLASHGGAVAWLQGQRRAAAGYKLLAGARLARSYVGCAGQAVPTSPPLGRVRLFHCSRLAATSEAALS